MKKNIISFLKERGFIFQITNIKNLYKLLNNNIINLYCGFDPNNDSLHIGHLIVLICIKIFLKYNHNVKIIIGESTSLIGDPSFKKEERNINYNKYYINNCIKKIKSQINNILDNNNKILILNNKKWLNNIKYIDFLKDIGKYIKINYILNKDFIKKRLYNINNKLSYKEFTYSILQGYDFLYLYKKYNVILQIGGSDQWSNILIGKKIIKKVLNKNTYGLTLPIITNNSGEKIGKNNIENKKIWLDKKKTNSYEFYQYFLNIKDNVVYNYLKYFTEIKLEDINDLLKNKNNYKNYILAKEIIADTLTEIVHGNKELIKVKKITKKLFSKNIFDINIKDLDMIFSSKKIKIIEINKEINIQNILIKLNITKSYRESKKIIEQKSIKINKILNNNIMYNINKKDILYNKYILLSKGKKEFYLIKWTN